MSDDKKIGAADRRTVSEAQDYELRYFARKHTSRSLKPGDFSSFTATNVQGWRKPSRLRQDNPSVGPPDCRQHLPRPAGLFSACSHPAKIRHATASIALATWPRSPLA
jgi:hypothetical protein